MTSSSYRDGRCMADPALRLRRAIDVALNCLAIDVGADRIPPQEKGGGGRGYGNENDCIDDNDDDDDDVVVPMMDETVIATGGKGMRKGGRGGEGRRTTCTRVPRRRDGPGRDKDRPPLRVVQDEDPRGWGDEHRPEGVGEGRRWRSRRRRGRRWRDEGRMSNANGKGGGGRARKKGRTGKDNRIADDSGGGRRQEWGELS